MQSQQKMPTLKAGDQIRIVAPASAVEESYIENTIESLEGLGYQVTLGKHLMQRYHQFAGTDQQRLSDFQEALDDPQVQAIFCARGGYGSVRIIDRLNFDRFQSAPKWIAGFSDITVFHAHINCHMGLPTLHAPMPVNFSSTFFQENLKQLNRLLQNDKPKIQFLPDSLNMAGKATGHLVGGNLSILYSLQATPYELDTHQAILFIEDVGEQLYHLDRMMNNFRLSCKFNQLSGLVVGDFSEMKDKKRPFGKNFREIIAEYFFGMNIPVAFNFPAGHTENHVPLRLGSAVDFQVHANGASITYL